MIQNNTNMVCVIMYYDKISTENGDGFYPVFQRTIRETHRIDITFRYYNKDWIQMDNMLIYGLDKYTGMYLLKLLNSKINEESLCIRNYGGRIIYPFIYECSTNKIIDHYSNY